MIRVSLLSLLLILPGAGQLEDFLASPILKTASVGVVVLPLDGDEALMSHQADLALIPASALKAVTTATALQILGADHVFETRLFLKGDDLVVQGGGDPTLGAEDPEEDFAQWLEALKKAGLTELKGKIIGDPSRFESQRTPNSWPWGDVGNYYGAGPSGLNYHRNTFALVFKPGELGARAELVQTNPTPPGVDFQNDILTGPAGSGDRGYVYGGPQARVMSMRGTVPEGEEFTLFGALPDPPLSCVHAFRDYLRKNDFPVAGEAEVSAAEIEDAQLVLTQKSPSLKRIIRKTNFRSVNLYADSLFKGLTAEGTTEASVGAIKTHWKEQGIELEGFKILDGSGLSPRNLITARQLAMILKKAREHESGTIFYESLPLAGRSGSVRDFGKDTEMEGRVRVKPGGMSGVRTYAGYLTNKSGKEFAFAVLTNNTLKSPSGIIETLLSEVIEKPEATE